MSANDRFDCMSPIDYRYWDEGVAEFLSEAAFTRYKLRVELALVKALCKQGICDKSVVKEVAQAICRVGTREVYDEEGRIRHDIRALVNCLQARVSEQAKPFIHIVATSFDIVDPANVLRFRDVTYEVVLPALVELERTLIEITLREAETVQIGRTHGQHAVPITFGFAMAEYVNRLGACIVSLKELAGKLVGKFSGAVGAYNASSLLLENPELFEEMVLEELGLKPAIHSTQIVPPEPMARFLNEFVMTGGVLANLACDMRHLQRTEIAEAGERFGHDQVGSSTMPQKRNPIGPEHVQSLWKILVGRMITVLLDQVSEHQRDLTNSASSRTYGEIVCYLVVMVKRLTKVMSALEVDHSNMERNLKLQQGLTAAEPLYILLAALQHPNAHEAVRQFTLQAQQTGKTLWQIAAEDSEIAPYLERMTPAQRKILSDPTTYTGVAATKAIAVALHWGKKLSLGMQTE